MTGEGRQAVRTTGSPVFSLGARGGKPLNPETGGWGVAAAGVLFCLEAKRALELKKKKTKKYRLSSQSSMTTEIVLSENFFLKKKEKKEGGGEGLEQ